MGYGPDIISRQFHIVHWMNIDKHCWNPLTSEKENVRYLWVKIKDVFQIKSTCKHKRNLWMLMIFKSRRKLSCVSKWMNLFCFYILFSKISRLVLRPPRSLIQRVSGVLSPVVEWPGRKVDCLPLASAEDKNDRSYSSIPPMCLTAWTGLTFLDFKLWPCSNVVCFPLGNFPASEFYMPTFPNTLFHLNP